MTDGKIPRAAQRVQAAVAGGHAQAGAATAGLVYVNDRQPGISRVRAGADFHYFSGRKKIRDGAVLERIRKLAVPPAWENVWICKLPNGHLQATGTDAKKRKQYKYHAQWMSQRNHTKFCRLLQFGKCLSRLRQRLDQDLSRPGLPTEKVLAAVVCLMDQAGFRIGNSAYEKLYGSFGATTLKDQHVKIDGPRMQFRFVGKKGVAHKVSIKNRRLARIVKNCRDIPGRELFQYYDPQGNHRSVDSGMVNAYLRDITGEDFTAKDFRTWAGTVRALAVLRELGAGDTAPQNKKNLLAALDCVAQHLGNTRTVCKKYYVHPIILSLYEENRLHTFCDADGPRQTAKKNGPQAAPAAVISRDERTLMRILARPRAKPRLSPAPQNRNGPRPPGRGR